MAAAHRGCCQSSLRSDAPAQIPEGQAAGGNGAAFTLITLEPARSPNRGMLDTALIALSAIGLFAAFVNGALGYGFSSLTVPLALVFLANRVLNPAVVVIEVFINLYVLFINRNGVPAVWKRVCPILIGLLPGIAVGASVLASLQPGW